MHIRVPSKHEIQGSDLMIVTNQPALQEGQRLGPFAGSGGEQKGQKKLHNN